MSDIKEATLTEKLERAMNEELSGMLHKEEDSAANTTPITAEQCHQALIQLRTQAITATNRLKGSGDLYYRLCSMIGGEIAVPRAEITLEMEDMAKVYGCNPSLPIALLDDQGHPTDLLNSVVGSAAMSYVMAWRDLKQVVDQADQVCNQLILEATKSSANQGETA